VIDLGEMLADLEALVGAESPSHDIDRLSRSARTLAAIIERRLGSPPVLVESVAGPHVHWSGGGEPTLLVVGHHDTVFPAGTLGQRPFTVADGRATGPGVFDMKAGIVQAIHAVAQLADPSGVELLFTADEEVGSASSRPLIEARAQACGAVLVVEPSADGGALKTGRKGVGTYEVIVGGRASHAGLEPEKGVNALVAAAEVVVQVALIGRSDAGTTVTPTMCSAGTADNVVPAQARVRVDVRVALPEEEARVDAAMAALITSVPGATIQVFGGISRPPMHESASSTLFPMALAAAREMGLDGVRGVSVGGGSDGNFTAALGIPTLDGLGAVGGGAHADHEHVLVDTMVDRTMLLAGLLRRAIARPSLGPLP